MFKKHIAQIMGAAVGLGISIFCFSSPVFASTNLLTNPGAESNGTGWNTISNDGNGMSYNFDGFVHSGTQSFQTSYGLDSIYQTVDLFANGYSASSMGSSPSIRFGVWLGTRNDQGGQYYVKFTLLEQDGTTVVTSTNFGTSGSLLQLPAGTGFFEVNYTFSGYGSGVRYASIEFGGQDQSGWAGNYGTHFDDASIVAAAVPVTSSAGGGGGSAMPSWGYVPPKGPFSLTLDRGGSTTDKTEVALNILASSDVDRMAFSRYADFHDSGIIPFGTSLPWSICGMPICTAGTYDVYAKFYQSYGLSSPVQHLVITYTPTSSVSSSASKVTITPVTVSTSSTVSVVASDTAKISPFTHNLRFGNQGTDIKRLQIFLNKHGYILTKTGLGSPGEETEVFGPSLKQAISKFQEANAKELLIPFGLKKGTGIFGARTRSLVNTLL